MRKTLVITAAVLLTAVWAVPPVGASAAAQGMSPSTRLVAAGLGAQGWAAADLTDVTGATGPGDNAALTAVVSEADDGGTQLNVIYRDRNNHARQLYRAAGDSDWGNADLTDLTGATRPGDNANPTAVVSEADGGDSQLNVIYRDRNNHARQLYQ